MSETGVRVLVCTAPAGVATELARALLEAKLIGCANLLPGLRSLYWWEGEIQDDAEVMLWMETPREQVEAAVEALERAHPYDLPKILVLRPEAVNAPYARWLREVAGPTLAR